MREIVLDTETTGLDPIDGHRLIEIGCLELENHVPTGKTYHQYINPERGVPAEAIAIHGLNDGFLKDKPVFSEIYDGFLKFIGDATLVIHNAAFDMKFLNAELQIVGHKALSMTNVVDTLLMTRQKFPGSPANLDALCRRFGIDNSDRELHGALLDSELLAEVYLELLGGRQHGLGLVNEESNNKQSTLISAQAEQSRTFREPRPHQPEKEELTAHASMLEELTDPIWRD